MTASSSTSTAIRPTIRCSSTRASSPGGCGRRGRAFCSQERRLAQAARADKIDVLFSPAYTCPLTLARPRVTAVHDLSFFDVPEDFSVRDGLRRRLLVGGEHARLDRHTRLLGVHAPADRAMVPGPGRARRPRPPRRGRRPATRLLRARRRAAGSMRRDRCSSRWARSSTAGACPCCCARSPGWSGAIPTSCWRWSARTARSRRWTFPWPCARSASSATSAWPASSPRRRSPTATRPPTRRCSSPNTRASACPRWRRWREACRRWSAAGPSLGEIFGEAALTVEPRDELAVEAALERVLTDAALALGPRGPRPRAGRPLRLVGDRAADARGARLGGAPRHMTHRRPRRASARSSSPTTRASTSCAA